MRISKCLSILLIIICETSICKAADDSDMTAELIATGLPLIEINTVNGVEPTCDYVKHPIGSNGKSITNMTNVPGRMTITIGEETVYDCGDYKEDLSGMKLRIRGNASAWDHNPKPYKIKLEKKADLLRRGNDDKYKDKNWILLNPKKLYCKIGLMVNELAGLQWTPAHEYVNVMLNGSYLGMFVLIESVRRNRNCRIDVDDTGFLFEYDQYWWNEDVYVESFITSDPMHYTFKYPKPEDITDDQIAYFKEMIGRVEQSINDGTYPKYIDMDSFARWILAHDILGNWDGTGANYFLTKYDNTESTKVMMANLWDFDGIFQTTDDFDETHYNFVFQTLLNPQNKNKEFINEYLKIWDELSPTIFDEVIQRLEHFKESDQAEKMDKSFKIYQTRYNQEVFTVDQYVNAAKSWMTNRKEWMSNALNMLRLEASAIHTVKTAPQKEQMYTIDGRKIGNSPHKALVIMVDKNGKRKKVFNR